ncbi:3-hydroxyacyl-CoA dehydrogenase/enoyl-CoA hydratase family protein [Nannocystis sp.]|uniref:3-hydroxyacyl-CoA dehydrogenase/enoyl-CoA hydratase family protein n=1 Tax=Nannocystis sp. TaxID=1962667 RepID=UPI0025DF01D4|nr:3-hydroxyacyl-CoA dehydrogenase/enoyl-CoA hydratase family protein [Nannocystis sp.]MBK7830539.1 enoyl-CoA hydratase/isomerase family protein [Nannocystis sp.]
MSLLRPTHLITATVLGAGTMGAQIAAHLANAGIRTFLLDMVPRDTPAGAPKAARNALALAALQQLLKAKPAAYTDPGHAARITPGNLEDDLERACAASDLVIEAVVERLDIKQTLFTRVAAAAGPHAILSSNTSGLGIGAIAEGLPEAARARLVGMHFFNPPRYMHLLEVVPSRHSDPAVVAELANFSDRVLGKGVVLCRDTPNFIGNRVGTAEMLLTFTTTAAGDYSVEEVDLLNGPLMGRPRTASYRLGDLVGIDVVGHVIRNLAAVLSSDPASPDFDELHQLMVVPPMIEQMLQRRLLGDKTKSGFYRKQGKAIQTLDLHTLEYRDNKPAVFPELAEVATIRDLGKRVAAALRAPGRAGEFLRKVYLPLFNYAAARVGVICDTAKQIDDAMCWGYGWQLGPFALMDAAGVAWCAEQLTAMSLAPAPALRELVTAQGPAARWYAGRPSAPTVFVPGAGPTPITTPAGVLILAAAKDTRGELHSNKTASLIDIGDGIACLEFRGKMNVLDDGAVTMLGEALPTLARIGGFRGLVIGNQGENFCAGADLRTILAAAEARDFATLERAVATLQNALMDLRHGDLPVVVAPHGLTLGGGVEVTLHGDAVVANSELYMGLVEIGVGLLPAGGGLKEMARRASEWAAQVPDGDPYPFVRRAFENAAAGKVSTSAHEARALGFLTPGDSVVFHRARVVAEAKRRAIGLAEAGYVPPDRAAAIALTSPGRGASLLMGAQMFFWGGYASAHDQKIAQKIAQVLCGGMTGKPSATAQELLDREREAFCSLAGEPATVARIKHMLETGKPLRN